MEAAGNWTNGSQLEEDAQSDEYGWFNADSDDSSSSMSARSISATATEEWAAHLQAPWRGVALPAGRAEPLHRKRSREEGAGPTKPPVGDHPELEVGGFSTALARAAPQQSAPAGALSTTAELDYREARVTTPLVDPRAIYTVICAPRTHGGRPDRVTTEDGGRLFLESVSGQPGKVKKERRAKRRGQDTWYQHDSLWMKIVPGVVPARGQAPEGTVWVSARYGDVICHQLPSTEDSDSSQQKTFHMFDLFLFTGDPSSVPSAWVSGGVPRKERQSFASRCTWQQGTLYHLPWAAKGTGNLEPPDAQSGEPITVAPPPVWPSGGARLDQSTTEAKVQATQTHSFSGRIDLELADGDKRWLRMADESGKERGVLQLGDGGHIELVGTSGDFGAFILAPLQARALHCLTGA